MPHWPLSHCSADRLALRLIRLSHQGHRRYTGESSWARYKFNKVKLLLALFSKKLTNLKTKLAVLGEAHANKVQDLESLTTQKDAITEETTQVLETKELERRFQGTLFDHRFFLPFFLLEFVYDLWSQLSSPWMKLLFILYRAMWLYLLHICFSGLSTYIINGLSCTYIISSLSCIVYTLAR